MSSPIEKDLTVRVQLAKGLNKYLDMEDITEIAVNKPGEVWLEKASGWECCQDSTITYSYLEQLGNICAVFGGENKVFDTPHPVLSVELPDGERAQFVMPPACTSETISLTVRKISKNVIELDDYLRSGFFSKLRPADSEDPVSRKLHDLFINIHSGIDEERSQCRSNFLKRCVEVGKNIVIAGGTGSGKTTFMKALMQFIPYSQRIITIEDVPELVFGLPKHKNLVNLFYPSEATEQSTVTASSLMRSCLRMKPDRILLAELRGGETFDFLNICLSGHSGSITSCHAGSCQQVFDYLGLKVLQSPTGRQLPHDVIQGLLRQVIDVVVHIQKDKKHGRYITGIYYNDPLSDKEDVLCNLKR